MRKSQIYRCRNDNSKIIMTRRTSNFLSGVSATVPSYRTNPLPRISRLLMARKYTLRKTTAGVGRSVDDAPAEACPTPSLQPEANATTGGRTWVRLGSLYPNHALLRRHPNHALLRRHRRSNAEQLIRGSRLRLPPRTFLRINILPTKFATRPAIPESSSLIPKLRALLPRVGGITMALEPPMALRRLLLPPSPTTNTSSTNSSFRRNSSGGSSGKEVEIFSK